MRAKVEQFALAAAGRDYKTICNQVLAPTLVARLTAAGVTCEQGMQIALGDVQAPSLSIGRITVSRARASVITLSTAKGQQASIDALELIKTPHGWRLSSLASPLQANPG